MRNNNKKIVVLALITTLVLGTLSGCSSKNESEKNEKKPYEGVKLKWTMLTSTNTSEADELIALVKEKTGIEIEKEIVPEAADDEIDNIMASLMAGDEGDIVYYAAPRLKPLINEDLLEPVDSLASRSNYHMEKIYGDYLPVFGDSTWGLPAFSDIWLTLYNKSVFDNAKVPYPKAENWTWDKYIETAKKLTDHDNGVYGSLMLDYNCYNYMTAQQKGIDHYNKDETATNYDDPQFKNALQFFWDLGNKDKIQPGLVEFVEGNVAWDAFFSQDSEYGMFVCGGWTLQMMSEKKDYPRDWNFGVLPMPYPEGSDPSTLAVPGSYAIPKSSQNKEAAFQAIACMAENQYTLGYGRIPARIDLTESEIQTYIGDDLVNTYKEDGITVDDIRAAWFDPKREIRPEKVIGPADDEINTIWTEVGQDYALGKINLDKAMEQIKNKSDKAIQKSE